MVKKVADDQEKRLDGGTRVLREGVVKHNHAYKEA